MEDFNCWCLWRVDSVTETIVKFINPFLSNSIGITLEYLWEVQRNFDPAKWLVSPVEGDTWLLYSPNPSPEQRSKITRALFVERGKVK